MLYKHLFRYVCIGLLPIILFSCEKKSKTDPLPGTVLTDKNVVGKWEVTAVRTLDYKNDTLLGKYEFIKDVGGVQDGQRVGTDPWIWQYHTTYLTFQDGHTFFHTDGENQADGYMLSDFLPYYGGTWSVLNTEQMELTTKDFVGNNRPDKKLVWEVVGFTGNYISMGTVDTAISNGQKLTTYFSIELERR